jgi:putative ABC transport system permease protein
MLGVSIMIATWSTAGSLMRDFLGRVHFADAFAFRTSGLTPQDQAAIASLSFVTSTCAVGYLPVRIIGQHVFGVRGLAPTNVVCVGFPPDTFFEMNRVDWLAGNPTDAIAALKRGDSVIVAEQFLKARQMTVGDTIRLGAGRVEHSFTIAGVVGAPGLEIAIQFFGIQSAYNEAALSCVFMDMETVRRCFDNPDVHVMQVNLAPGTTDDFAESQVRAVAPTVLFRSGRQIRQTLDDIANALLTVNTTVAFSALLLASLSVGNVIAANIHSRRFEYGVLRAVGGGRGVVVRLILAEAAMLAIAAAIVGTLLGMHLAWMETRHYLALAGIELHLRFPASAALIGWFVLLLMALLAAAPTAISLARQRPTMLLSAGRNG